MTWQQQDLVGRAMTKLADNCVASYGLTPTPGLLGAIAPPGTDLLLAHWMSVRSAQRYGYAPPLTVQQNEVNALLSTTRSSPPVFGVLYGTASAYHGKAIPTGGCMAKAKTELVGSLQFAFPLTQSSRPAHASIQTQIHAGKLSPGEVAYQNLTGLAFGPLGGLAKEFQAEAFARMKADARLASATQRWGLCMRQAGFNYPSPQAAQSDKRWGPWATQASVKATHSLQLAVATADARCENRVDYAGVRLALLTDAENQLINAHASALAAYRKAQQRLLASARSVLAGRGAS